MEWTSQALERRLRLLSDEEIRPVPLSAALGIAIRRPLQDIDGIDTIDMRARIAAEALKGLGGSDPAAAAAPRSRPA